MNFRAIENASREKELKSTAAAGEDQPSIDDVDRIEQERSDRAAALKRDRMNADMSRVETNLRKGMVCVPSSFKPTSPPIWDENQNDTFAMRLQVIDRFMRASSRLLARLRADRRIRCLKRALRSAGVSDREACKVWIEEEAKYSKLNGVRGTAGASGSSRLNRSLLSLEDET